MSLKESLLQIPLFQTLKSEEYQWLEDRLQYHTISGKSTVYAAGEIADEMFFVLQGKVKTVVYSGDDQFIKRLCFKGSYFGEHGIFEIEERRETAFTLKDETHLAGIRTADLKNLMHVNFTFSEALFKTMCEQIRCMERRLAGLAFQEARPRLIACLKDLVHRQGLRVGVEWVIPFHLTHEELGAYTGAGRLSVTEMLTDLRRANLIHYDRDRMLIRDIDRLR
jgi:CRP-like cAMP-binding protein